MEKTATWKMWKSQAWPPKRTYTGHRHIRKSLTSFFLDFSRQLNYPECHLLLWGEDSGILIRIAGFHKPPIKTRERASEKLGRSIFTWTDNHVFDGRMCLSQWPLVSTEAASVRPTLRPADAGVNQFTLSMLRLLSPKEQPSCLAYVTVNQLTLPIARLLSSKEQPSYP